jgi:hypothetical protein
LKQISLSYNLFFSAIILVFTLASCEKEDSNPEMQTVIDNMAFETEFASMIPLINNVAAANQTAKSAKSSSLSTINNSTNKSNSYPITKIIDYGTGTVDPIDNKTRKGQIVITLDSSWDTIGATVTVEFVNYYMSNGSQFTCDSMKIIHAAAHTLTFDIINGHFHTPDWDLFFSSTKTLTQIAGMEDTDSSDDVFQFTGHSNGVNREGKPFSSNILVPIVKKYSCSWLDSGQIVITPEGLAIRIVDLGTGTCDNKGTITINGDIFTFSMN